MTNPIVSKPVSREYGENYDRIFRGLTAKQIVELKNKAMARSIPIGEMVKNVLEGKNKVDAVGTYQHNVTMEIGA